MKKTLLFTVLLISTFVLLNCGKNANSIIGKWEITKAEGTMAETNVGTVYEFTDEKNFAVTKDGFRNPGTYTHEGDNFNLTIGSITITAIIKIDGDKMRFEIKGSDQKFDMVRK